MKVRFYTSVSMSIIMAIMIYKVYSNMVEGIEAWRKVGYVEFMEVKDELIISHGIVAILFIGIMGFFLSASVDNYKAWKR